MEVGVDDVEVAESGVFQPDSHNSSFVDVEDVLVGNFVEVFEEIGVDECEYARGLFRSRETRMGESFPVGPMRPRKRLWCVFLGCIECWCCGKVCGGVSAGFLVH